MQDSLTGRIYYWLGSDACLAYHYTSLLQASHKSYLVAVFSVYNCSWLWTSSSHYQPVFNTKKLGCHFCVVSTYFWHMVYLLNVLIFVLNTSMSDVIFRADYFKVHWFLKNLWCFSLKTVGILLAAAIVKYFKTKRGFLALWLSSSLSEAVILSVFYQNEVFFILTKIKWIFEVW